MTYLVIHSFQSPPGPGSAGCFSRKNRRGHGGSNSSRFCAPIHCLGLQNVRHHSSPALPVQMAKQLAQLPGPGAKPTLTLDLTQNQDLWVTE